MHGTQESLANKWTIEQQPEMEEINIEVDAWILCEWHLEEEHGGAWREGGEWQSVFVLKQSQVSIAKPRELLANEVQRTDGPCHAISRLALFETTGRRKMTNGRKIGRNVFLENKFPRLSSPLGGRLRAAVDELNK